MNSMTINDDDDNDNESVSTKNNSSNSFTTNSALDLLETLDVRRFDMLVNAGPNDFSLTKQVMEVPNDELDWSNSIFHTVTDPTITAKLQKRFGQRPLWGDKVLHEAITKARKLPSQQYIPPPPIVNFVNEHCHLKNEHADGGLFDHLDYCAEYCARYMSNKSSSPTVLWLHSICGVNTNLFPLEFTKIPELDTLLNRHECMHIHAFPGMLRLLFFHLMDTLWDIQQQQENHHVIGITMNTFHGTEVTLVKDEFWIHLNYQLIHQLDFLPIQNYQQWVLTDNFTRLFFRLHQYLRQEKKLYANINLHRLTKIPGMTAKDQELPTWEHLYYNNTTPEERVTIDKGHEAFGALMKTYSKAINHDMTYELHWSDGTSTTHTP